VRREIFSAQRCHLTSLDLADLAPAFVPDRLFNRDLPSALYLDPQGHRPMQRSLLVSRLALSSARCAFIRPRYDRIAITMLSGLVVARAGKCAEGFVSSLLSTTTQSVERALTAEPQPFLDYRCLFAPPRTFSFGGPLRHPRPPKSTGLDRPKCAFRIVWKIEEPHPSRSAGCVGRRLWSYLELNCS